jgi:hypothetical protein
MGGGEMQRHAAIVLGGLLALGACGGDADLAANEGPLSTDAPAPGAGWQPEGGTDLDVQELDCPHGGKVGAIQVEFACQEITVVSCKDLSNVVIELTDGTRRRFEGLQGQRGVFSSPAVITSVWVKAGANASGDGPGYGERFDAPVQSCSPPSQPPAGDAGCFVADGLCEYTPTPPKLPRDAGAGVVGY